MLKWTASAQKIMQETTAATTAAAALRTPMQRERRPRCQRRVTIANNNKENIMPLVGSYATSTPMTVGRASLGQRTRNSPLVLAPLADIRNVTPTTEPTTPLSEQRRLRQRQSLPAPPPPPQPANEPQRQRVTVEHVYAATLPRFEEVEYSPSAAPLLPSGQHLALRGLLPLPLQLDPFVGNPRYFTTPDVEQGQGQAKRQLALPKKRKLEQEFAAIVAQEQQEQQALAKTRQQTPPAVSKTKPSTAATCFSSSKMGDQTLDKLIDAILDSACKEEKKQKKSRKSFNLRRRTLLKNQQMDALHEQAMLSPSYAAGDDPASDLSFLLCEPKLLATPEPATPLPGTPIPLNVLTGMPTPTPLRECNVSKSNTFTLATPVRPLAHKRRRGAAQTQAANVASPVKKFKVDASNYFEIGLALPSIYV